jgi:hypothetical protein
VTGTQPRLLQAGQAAVEPWAERLLEGQQQSPTSSGRSDPIVELLAALAQERLDQERAEQEAGRPDREPGPPQAWQQLQQLHDQPVGPSGRGAAIVGGSASVAVLPASRAVGAPFSVVEDGGEAMLAAAALAGAAEPDQ